MLQHVEFLSAAADEVRAAHAWYVARNEAAGAGFLNDLDDAVSNVAESPERWPRYLHGTRRYVFRRFPYSLVYRTTPACIQVVAVVHGRRRPGYWKDRAEKRFD